MKWPTKRGFQRWLESLPEDESFCEGRNCPLMQYYGLSFTWDYGQGWKKPFRNAVDDLPRTWHRLTPRECLEVLPK